MIRRPLPFLVLALIALASACIPASVGNGEYRNGGHHIKLGTVDDLYRFLTYTESRYPLISAHRGGPASGFPENAIETFENSYRYQPLIIECDVRMTNDSVLVLLHDETLDRTTTGSGKVADWNFSELRELYLKDPDGKTTRYRIPSLDEALQWGAGKVIFTIDVKRDVPYAFVIDAIQRNHAQAYSVIITYNAGQAATVHQLAPDLMISASIRSREDLLRLNDRSIPDNRLVAFVGTSNVAPAVYGLLHDHGILCILGTIGNIDKQAATRGDTVYRHLVENGADILATDRPREAGDALHAYRLAHKLTSNFIN
ncbi:glycerophosphodiester phosphodiesterase family protein [Parapedobacter sp. 10938]|uniref:glycerophosphodiester phosphodiesterase family protein n=1 Tax=Parapedobacter flavus TaxID=3110225 RepID=UPI002DB67BBD|nr:glycerophosphodiester phosphodiesterase family protein [Parapedobacter sp. 10938]MEC3880365.1 glycerophosphodiester phosphodiesterase family protein [Parapedobacter sp. 10938]